MTELRNIVRKKNEAILLGPSSRVDLAQDQAFFSLEGDATRLPAPCSSTPYTTVYITPTAVFRARLFENQEGADTERYVFGKLLARRFQRRPFRHRHCFSCEDIGHGESAQGCVIYTVVYG